MFYNQDCIEYAHGADEGFVDLMICDPPFGINEKSFDKHYNRSESKVIDGYVEAPTDYADFSTKWIQAAHRMLSHDGSMFVVIGHSNLRHVLNAAHNIGFNEINHIIWKYNFGVNTKNKFVTSHYHILYYSKDKSNRTFNTSCRFGSQEKTESGGSKRYQDLEDVFVINREYAPGKIKNKNKLPNALIEKLILYASNPEDVVFDFFLGNFTTACVAKSLGRSSGGCELNHAAFYEGINKWNQIEYGSRLKELNFVDDKKPKNQGKPFQDGEKESIRKSYDSLKKEGYTKKAAVENLQEAFGRGKFSILNVLKNEQVKS